MNTGELIRKHRKEKKITMKELGKIVGVSEQAISQYERGLRNVNLETLIKISKALNVEINALTEKKLNPSQQLIQEEFIDKGISLEQLSLESGIEISDLNNLYKNNEGVKMQTYFDLCNYLGLDNDSAVQLIIEDSRVDSIYNNDGTDPLKNKLRKFYLGEPLSIDDMTLGIEDPEKVEFISNLFRLGGLNHLPSDSKTNESHKLKTPIGFVYEPDVIDDELAYQSLVNLLFYTNDYDSLLKFSDDDIEVLLKKVCNLLDFELFKKISPELLQKKEVK